MGFDDLARHMAARDKRSSKPAAHGNADAIVAQALVAQSRMDRTRDLILGPILLLGGLVAAALFVLYLADVYDDTPSPDRPPTQGRFPVPSIGAFVACAIAIGVGVKWTWRGLRGRRSGLPRATIQPADRS